MKHSSDGQAGRIKSAELASALGAGVLGAGLALLAPSWVRSYAVWLVVGGIAVHGAGMSLKYRFESRDAPPLWWERTLFWLCWALLAALAMWLGIAAATR